MIGMSSEILKNDTSLKGSVEGSPILVAFEWLVAKGGTAHALVVPHFLPASHLLKKITAQYCGSNMIVRNPHERTYIPLIKNLGNVVDRGMD
ncbi:hypothetical protein FRB91_008247 [Serendipita sp. 411]|nr:hypothetical protein FRB91_008247 [Serendipita sp. 411]